MRSTSPEWAAPSGLLLIEWVQDTWGVAPSWDGPGLWPFAPFGLLAEQRRMVAKVEQLMVLVDALAAQLAASQATGERLLAVLVAETHRR